MILEATLVLPILMFLVMGLIDFGFASFRISQASSAARDGARVGIIQYLDADIPGSTNNDAIVAAVDARLAGETINSVTVTCMDASDVVKDCDNAVVIDIDYIEVEVDWQFVPMTFVGGLTGSRTMTSTAKMVITGGRSAPPGTAPTTTTTAGSSSTTSTTVGSSTTSLGTTTTTSATQCEFLNFATAPNPAVKKSKNSAASNLAVDQTFVLTTNGHASCDPDLRVQFGNTTANNHVLNLTTPTSVSGGTYTWVVDWNETNKWTVGTKEVRATSGTLEVFYNFPVINPS